MSSVSPLNNQLYMRQCTLSILTWGGETIQLTEDFRIVFRVEKNINNQFQHAEITVYNLDPDTETDIFKNGQSVVLEAGYENGPYGQIFRGDIFQPIRGKEDAVTYFLRLVCLAGYKELGLGFCSFALTADNNARTIAEQIARSASIPFDLSVDQELKLLQGTQRGKVVVGSPGQHLRSIALNNNAVFYFDDGIANLSAISKAPPPIVPELNASNGMVGIPHQLDLGVAVRCLINPNIRIDSWIKLNNQDVIQAQLDFESGQLQTLLDLDGIYRVISLVSIGDTRGNDWYHDLETWNHSGNLPAMLTSDGQVST